MNKALAVLSLVVAVAAEAPYHLPRPAGHVPAFHLPAPGPAPPHFGLQHQQNSGYQYQQPSIAPAFVQQHNPVHHHQHHQHHQHLQHQQPAQAYFPPAPAPQPLPVSYPQPQLVPFPQPRPVPFHQAQAAPFPQAQGVPFPQPSSSYGLPHSAQQVQPQPAPFHNHQTFSAQHAPQPHFQQPISFPQPQFSPQQGYNYQQPQPLPQFSQQIPLQAQPLSNHIGGAASLSSYQADSHQYSGAHEQIHRDALDSVVIGRLQNIIKEDEHSSAKNAGYLSLVSGVSLENAKPSLEISSFVQTSPLGTGHSSGLSSHGSSLSSSLGQGYSAPSGNYGLPSLSANPQLSTSGSFNSGSFNFLPQNKPAQSYGPPH